MFTQQLQLRHAFSSSRSTEGTPPWTYEDCVHVAATRAPTKESVEHTRCIGSQSRKYLAPQVACVCVVRCQNGYLFPLQRPGHGSHGHGHISIAWVCSYKIWKLFAACKERG